MKTFFCEQANFCRFVIFPIFHQNTCYLLNIEVIFGKCWHSFAAVAPVKYEWFKEQVLLWNPNGEINERNFGNPHPLVHFWPIITSL